MLEDDNRNEILSKSHWFTCDGGPLVLLPSSERGAWGRTHPADVIDPNSDYQRAGKIKGPFGLIAFGSGQALVLAGSPKLTFWDHSPDEQGIDLCVFLQWKSRNLDDLRRLALTAQSRAVLSDTEVEWRLPDDGVTLMFAGDSPGHSAYGEVTIPIKPGIYQLLKGSYKSSQGQILMLRIKQKAA